MNGIKLFVWILLIIISFESYSQVSRNFIGREKPKYEWGAGLFAADIQDYPGSKESTLRVLPFPWLIYRGEILRLDEEGSRARVKNSGNFEIGLSGGFNFPVESNEISSRQGLPDLDALISFGPGLIWRFLTSSPHQQLNLNLGLRAAYSTNFKSRLRTQGYLIEPSLSYWRQIGESHQLTLITNAALTFADSNYNGFFYNIPENFSSANRPSFDAKAGLNQLSLFLGAAYQIHKKWQLFSGTFLTDLSLAKNKDSSLVEREQNLGFALGFVWAIGESKEKVISVIKR